MTLNADTTSSDSPEGALAVRVWRGGATGAFQTFEVARRPNQTVLDVVTEIQREQDPTLSYRFACRVGMCGSCAMVVNGRPRWTCRTRAAAVVERDELTLEPLRNLPVVKDLAVDMEAFFAKWRDAKGFFEPGPEPANDFAVVEPSTPKRQAADAGVECINCGVCYSACDLVAWNPDYLGPAALNRAWTLVNDVRDKGQTARLAAVSGDAGCHSCHSHMSCTEFCPKALAPTFAIAGLKRATARRLWRRG
ncbi:succinate dehydrogenase/fumarate reductase iron-sulfur subunit [Hansschlegelia zhihuaiae]|uniref:Succinate dehydrogenase iron-sulfur subunit n=1 Tax=Hansschlegelia zhihuaiae TaxID=405005 RepID=A0A4Q0MK93_9HYPH|nr:succinate dehydrogenase/fumarate reductase iron-sulfur subunit [Hansschlegelia zhihuaiae]RXF74171.1 succinate dehydrogenase/fumarate reductase iron-sulfur subunit [Hansschlegelia zhihuaiae]